MVCWDENICTRLFCPVTGFITKFSKFPVGVGGCVQQVQIKDYVPWCRLCWSLHECEGTTLHPTEMEMEMVIP